jgi:hypothetical protein
MPELDPKTKLPPVGHKRDEELKRRADNLQEKIETKMPEAYSLDPSKLKEDREILQWMVGPSLHEVSNKQPNRVYCWEYAGANGTAITAKRFYGWQAVQGDDPECIELKHVDTTRRLGDTMLLWMPVERHQKLLLFDEYKRRLQSSAPDDDFRQAASDLGLNAEVNSPRLIKRFGGQTPAQKVVIQGGGPVDRMLREGSIPGMEVNEA